MPPTEEEDKMEQLRRLDRIVTKTGKAVSIVVGVVGIIRIVSAYPIYIHITKKQREKVALKIYKHT